MQPGDDQLQPHKVDEQIEWLAQLASEGAPGNNQSAQLVQRLQGYYQRERQAQTLSRAWQSIHQNYTANQVSSNREESTQHTQKKPEKVGQYRMDQHITSLSPAKRRLPRWSTLVAIVVIALAVGSTAVIMSQVGGQTSHTGSGGGPIICISTPTPTPSMNVPATPTPTPSTQAPTPTPPPTPVKKATPTPVNCPTPQPTPTSPTITPTAMPQGTPTPAPPYPTPTPPGGNVPPTPTPTPSYPTTPTPPPTPAPTPTQLPPATPTPTPAP